MIYLTRLNGAQYCLMVNLIQEVEDKHNTMIKLTNGNTLAVKESAEEVRQRVIEFYRAIHTQTI